LSTTFVGQRQVDAPAEPFGGDAFDVAMANKDDLGHAVVLSRAVR
jgi:hypothetical protein